MFTSPLYRIRTSLLLLLIAAGLTAVVAPVAHAEAGECPVAECVIDDGTQNAAGPTDPVADVETVAAGANGADAEPQEISDDADDLDPEAGGDDSVVAEGDGSVAASNVDADHPIGTAWSEGPRAAEGDVAGAAAAPEASGSGASAPAGELPFTGTSGAVIGMVAGLGSVLVALGAAVHHGAARRA